ncbi:MAG: TIGR04282 family arsenosugar biosynthesis glycosyltransferase [Desulfurivibrionaceae bacterium]|nr:TIGR04282 family arsenosugar biosynthesis glycosyltransferase [Desulfurivibrionaceae bacterium]
MKRAKKEQEICIIFSRYPRPGAVKTRLIPHLGREGAAELQRRMTEKVVAEAHGLAARRPSLQVELAMAGAGAPEMAAWLGERLRWQQQVGADLGERMAFAIAGACRRGFQRVVLVGADCPGVTTDILAQAFDALVSKELVLGPSRDGGYYLIGLRSPNPLLFADIAWGSDQVLAQTLAAADQGRGQAALLACLADVDRPEDLDVLPPALAGALP